MRAASSNEFILLTIFAVVIGSTFSLVEESGVYEKGFALILNCTGAQGNAKWFKNNETIETQRMYTINGNSISFTVDKTTLGNYYCQDEDDEKMVSHDVFCKPVGDPENKAEKNAINGETFVFECKGFGNPQPVATWLKDGDLLDLSNTRIILKDNPGIVNGSLRMTGVEYEDAGVYTCLATNEHGNFTHDVKVNVKDQYAALWPFFGICVEVVILCSIIFIYEKRRSNRAREEQQKEEADHLTSNNDRVAEELRQRKV